MRVLLAIGAAPDLAWLGPALGYLPAGINELPLVHVVDVGPRHEWEQARERFVARAPLRPERAAGLAEAERARGAAVLAGAETAVRTAGYAGPIVQHLLAGHPEREIVAACAALQADLVVVRARERGGEPPGPKSVGHIARFVLDHAPSPVLLLRGAAR